MVRGDAPLLSSRGREAAGPHPHLVGDGSRWVRSMDEARTFHVYIVTGLSLRRVLYVGVTSNLVARIAAHRSRSVAGFTARSHLSKLVYAEAFPYARDGIAQEKQIEGWRRARKVALIERVNPHWTELSPGRL